MIRLLAVPAALFLAFAALAQQPPPKPAEITKLVEQLGSEDFTEREAAAKRLEELGPAAIEELRSGLKSDNPEMVRRAQDLLRKAEHRLATERATAPTLVELNARDQPLDAILAELSKQAKCEVVLGGVKPEEVAFKKLNVSTSGKVPFWSAVLSVCDAANLQIASAGGFVAPGAMPYVGRARAGVRVSADSARTVVLEDRGDMKRRPASLHGGILVEAVGFPKNTTLDQPAALLQVWPEPRLQWEGASGLKVTKATDAEGARLVAEVPSLNPNDAVRTMRNGMVLVRNPDGTATWLRDTGGAFQLPGGFKPNVRQAVVRFKSNDKPATAAKDLELALFAAVRGPIEPLSRVAGLEANQAGSGTGNAGVDLAVTYGRGENDRLIAKVELTYDPKTIHAASLSDDLPGVKGGAAGFGNRTVYGVRITDAEGKPYTLGLSSGASQFDPTGKRFVMKMTLELHPDKDSQGPPSVITFWGNHARVVELPVLLKNVRLTVEK